MRESTVTKAALNVNVSEKRRPRFAIPTIQELWASPTPEEIKAYTTFAHQEWENIETLVKKNGLEKQKSIFCTHDKQTMVCDQN